MEQIKPLAQTKLPTRYGVFHMAVFAGDNVALWVGDIANQVPLIRLHSECLTGDVFGSSKCDCGEQLDAGVRTDVTGATGDEDGGILGGVHAARCARGFTRH